MFCEQCGTKVADSARFCGACGQSIDTRKETSVANPPAHEHIPVGAAEKAPNTQAVGASREYTSYDQVPVYRKQWFFWITYIVFAPIALCILIFGDVYYQKKGKVKSFGLANRIVAGIIAVLWIWKVVDIILSST